MNIQYQDSGMLLSFSTSTTANGKSFRKRLHKRVVVRSELTTIQLLQTHREAANQQLDHVADKAFF